MHDRYLEIKYMTANPAELISMLYDGAIGFLKKAKEGMMKGKEEESNKYMMRVQDIICELISSLELEKGGEIASNLLSLYMYMLKRSVEANIRNDPDIVDEISALISDLKDAWDEAMGIGGRAKEERAYVLDTSV